MSVNLQVYADLRKLQDQANQQATFNQKLWDAFVSLTMVLFANDLHERECPRFEDKTVACDCIMAPVIPE